MKLLTLTLLLITTGILFSQEKISPLGINPSIYERENRTMASELNDLDSTFIYEYSNLDLEHVWDDFSISKFEQFDADFDDAGVTSVLYYRLMDETNTDNLEGDLIFCDSIYARHDTIKVVDGIEEETVTHYPFTPFDIWINDLDFYPVEGVLNEGVFQECYVLVDSLIDGVLDADQDTIWHNEIDGPAYVQDSARVFTKVVSDNNVIWEDNYACHNYTFAHNPWSLGVATFDGVDEKGRPYEFGNESAHGIGDYLTSRPINLAGESNVYLDFFYQAEGFGNMPEEIDSLIVEFWDVSDEIWYQVGFYIAAEPDQWDTAHIPVPVPSLENGFRFRFKNYASLSGALDHWHIDYVKLEADGFPTIDNVSDLAISYPLNTLLKDYTRVPWDHYVATSGNEKMLDKSGLGVYNSDLTATNFSNGALVIKRNDVEEGGSPYVIPSTGVAEPNYLTGYNQCLFDVASDYFYDQSIGGVQAAFDVEVNIASAGAGANTFLVNDTTKFTQKFDNYYAYDDGSVEAAYGIEGEGSLMAYKFNAYQSGELTGILMHFVPMVTDLSGEVFLLTVWEDDGGLPGEIIYQDDYFESHSPEYSGSKTGFKYYTFNNDDYLSEAGYLSVGETFYVGWQNISAAVLNIGLDWNNDNGDKVLRNTGSGWLESSYAISLMIRPVFSTGLDYTLSNASEVNEEQPEITLYPNPTSGDITLTGLSGSYELRIFDMSGRMVTSVQNEHQINVQSLENGMYIVDVRSDSGESIYSTKLIKN